MVSIVARSDELEVLAYLDLKPDEADIQSVMDLGDQITGLQNTAMWCTRRYTEICSGLALSKS